MNKYKDHTAYMLSSQERNPEYYSSFKSTRLERSKLPLKERGPFGVRMKLRDEYVVYDCAGWPVIEEQTGEPLSREAAEYICKSFNTLYAMELLNAGEEDKISDPYPEYLSPRTKPNGKLF